LTLGSISAQSSPGGVSSNLGVWLDASNHDGSSSGTYTNGAIIGSWRDLSGNALHGTSLASSASGTPGNNSLLHSGSEQFNYKPSINFDRTSFYSFPSGTFTVNDENYSYFVVMQTDLYVDPSDNNSCIINNGIGAGSTNEWVLAAYKTNGSLISNHFNVTASSNSTGAGGITANAPSIVHFSYDSKGVSTLGESYIYVNGALKSTTTGIPDKATDDSNHRLGALEDKRYFSGQMAEVIAYKSAISGTDRQKVLSYLSMKYGITLDNSVGAITSSSGVSVWNPSAAAGYTDNVMILGRDDASTLDNKQVKASGIIDAFIDTKATTNRANTGTVTMDESFLTISDNNAAFAATGSLEYPSGLNIYSRINREFRIENVNNFNNNFSIEFELTPSSISVSDLIVLIDSDGDFSNATTTTASLSYSNNRLTIGNLNIGNFPTGTPIFLTVASISSNTSLPIKLNNFTAKNIAFNQNLIQWSTSQEENVSHFTIERSFDGMSWAFLKNQEAIGSSSGSRYSVIDPNHFSQKTYYRLKEVNTKGEAQVVSSVVVVSSQKQDEFNIRAYPNPSTDLISIEVNDFVENGVVEIFGYDGQQYLLPTIKGQGLIKISCSSLAAGLYYIKIGSATEQFIKQ